MRPGSSSRSPGWASKSGSGRGPGSRSSWKRTRRSAPSKRTATRPVTFALYWRAPAMALKKGFRQLLAEAEHKAPGISVQAARERLGEAGTVFVDIRDVRELEREGTIPGAFHAPRG